MIIMYICMKYKADGENYGTIYFIPPELYHQDFIFLSFYLNIALR